MDFQFTHPHWLWLLPPSLAWVWWLTRKSDVQISPVRRLAACIVRLVVTLALILALAGLQWRTSIDGKNVIFVLDRSDSVPVQQQEAARQWVDRMANEKEPHDRAGVVAFGADASIESSATEKLSLPKIESVVPSARTDIGSAIQLATAAFPEYGQRRIVLLSDGNENLGDAFAAVASARSLGVNVDVVPLGGEKKADVSIQSLRVPPNVKKGQTFAAKVFATADQAGPATVSLYRNDQLLGRQAVQLEAGKNLFTFSQSLPDSGFYVYDVRMDAANDTVPQNNQAFAFTQVRGIPRVLIVSSDPEADAPLAAALESPALEVRMAEVNGFPASLAELQSYDAFILSNVSAADFTFGQQRLLESAVRDFGMGFVCIGGDQAYAAGAYRGTPLADMLPVDVEISSRKVIPPGALVLVIDKSGSMAGEKIEMARQGAMAAVEALSDRDFVGIIGFDEASYLVAPMQRASQRKEILRSIAGMSPGGGTSMYPPLVLAHKMLKGATASLKHCVVLTDGRSEPGDFPEIIRMMVEDRITVSTVSIGPDADAALLESIARQGEGRFYSVPAPAQLPQIFIKETAMVLKSAIREEPFVPQPVLLTEPVRGVEVWPPLLGYVTTEPKPRAETPLLTDQGDPLLAHWQFGLGRVAAFTSDARAKWAKNWMGWSHYQQFWKQVVYWSLRRLENSDLAVEVAMDRGVGRISVEALDEKGNYDSFLELQGAVVTPAGEKRSVRLQQTKPGHYEATFPMREPGAYLVNLMRTENGQVRAAQVVGASLNYSPELDAAGPNMHLLRLIADSTGGKVLDPSRPGSNPFHDDRRRTWQPHDLWEMLVKVAILLFVIDVGVRRLNPDPEQLQKAWRAVQSVALFWRRAPAGGPAAVEPSLSALLARRDQVRSQRIVQTVRADAEQASANMNSPSHPSPKGASVSESAQSGGDQEETSPSFKPGDEVLNTTDKLLEARRRARSREE